MADNAKRGQFIAGLVDIINADPISGLATVEAIRDAALARITKGKGQITTLIQGMLYGKQGQLVVGMDAMELFSAAAEAIRIHNQGQPITTAANFACLQR